ncbi:uncharacterized protein LOC119665910 [Teleopsis dalmanni]|uniref:uncharacterized protein LOC119665910 n=1 Tax=Teleopsis dalmanni TaxID=139649 RepID=UPI0018CE5AFD|nr:uncharacterized protein LOC119665910 [Teleopsis dalmanni]
MKRALQFTRNLNCCIDGYEELAAEQTQSDSMRCRVKWQFSHKLKQFDDYRCLHCGQVFGRTFSYKRHLLRHGANKKKKSAATSPRKLTTTKATITTTAITTATTNNVAASHLSQKNDSNCEIADLNFDEAERENNNNNITQLDFRENVLKFVLNLYAKSNLTRIDVIDIQESIQNLLLTPILATFTEMINSKLLSNLELKGEFLSAVFKYVNIFEWFVINEKETLVHQKGVLKLSGKSSKMAMLPLHDTMKKILEKDNYLSEMLAEIKKLKDSHNFTNIVQSSLWKKKCELYPEKVLIPYFLFIDDLELNNPLGSHASKDSICNVYYAFPCTPFRETNLNNIFLAACIKSQDLKTYGNNVCLSALVDEMIQLELKGINLNTSNQSQFVVYPILLLVLGDNLALNSVLGFTKSFNGVFCRFCKIDKNMSKFTISENSHILRTNENYKHDLNLCQPKSTGILEECVFERIPSFTVIENKAVDAMHDVLEGLQPYNQFMKESSA